jgi:hypothetical protein
MPGPSLFRRHLRYRRAIRAQTKKGPGLAAGSRILPETLCGLVTAILIRVLIGTRFRLAFVQRRFAHFVDVAVRMLGTLLRRDDIFLFRLRILTCHEGLLQK